MGSSPCTEQFLRLFLRLFPETLLNAAPSSLRRPLSGSSDFVSSDFSALASHMHACERSRGRFFALRGWLETAHALASPRIVTTAALFIVCGLTLLAVA
jgi:hypothetical protein